ALGEASSIGMGKGLSKNVRDSYYKAVKRETEEDTNESNDAVSLVREEMQAGAMPGWGLPNFPMSEQQSFAPFEDPEHGYDTHPVNASIKMASKEHKLYRFSLPQFVQDHYWYTTEEAAREAGANDAEGKLYVGTIADEAVVKHILREEKAALH